MPTKAERIQALKDRAAARRTKALALPAVVKQLAAADAEEAQALNLQTDYLKELADRKRKADKNAKIIIGAAVLLLSPTRFFQVMIELLAVLTARDRDRIRQWCSGRDIPLDRPDGDSKPNSADSNPTNGQVAMEESSRSNAAPASSSRDSSAQNELPRSPGQSPKPDATDDQSASNPDSPVVQFCPDPIGEALKRAIGGLDEGDISLFLPVFLKDAEANDRKVLEEWFASLTQIPAPGGGGAKSPDPDLQPD